MPIKKLLYGQRVSAQGKEGIIRECGDKFKVKFDDGTFGFFSEMEITPIVEDTRLKGSKFDRMKAENKLSDHTVLMPLESQGTDPLAQPVRRTGRGVGENQEVLGR